MHLPALETWIGGTAETSAIADSRRLHDPNSGAAIAESRSSSAEQVERAIAAAHAAHLAGAWAALGPHGRAPVLHAFADALDAVADRLALLDALNSGVPIAVTRLFAGSCGDTVRGAAQRAIDSADTARLAADGRDVRLHRVPWGVAALIVPWNAPAPMAVKKLAYSLAAGNTAVLKPSPESPLSAELILAAARESGLPDGVVSLVLGGAEVGAQLVADPRIRAISMTGSTPTGRAIAASAGPNLTRLRLELGSNNPAVVRADADLDSAAAAIVAGSLKLSGQWCEAPRRVIADRAILPPLTDALVAAIEPWRVGPSTEESTELGPVAFEARLNALEAQRDALVRGGAHAISVGAPRDAGWFFPPTIVVGELLEIDSEIFGPMLTLEPSDGDEHAVRLANSGQVGLAAYVFGDDEDAARRVAERLDAGEVKLNSTSVLDLCPESAQSFFGSAGIGGHGDADVLDFFSGKRIVGADAPGLPL